jgi:hypothetical protein
MRVLQDCALLAGESAQSLRISPQFQVGAVSPYIAWHI